MATQIIRKRSPYTKFLIHTSLLKPQIDDV